MRVALVGCEKKESSSTSFEEASESSPAIMEGVGKPPLVSGEYTEGLAYTPIANGESYAVAGIGTATDRRIVIPAFYEGKPVKIIPANAFADCTDLVSVSFEENSPLISIGERAFSNCTSLLSFTVPNGITSIGNGAFAGCTALAEVYNFSYLDIVKPDPGYGNYGAHGGIGAYALDIYTVSTQKSRLYTYNDFIFYKGDDATQLIKYIGHDTVITLPDDKVNSQYSIRGGAFSGCTGLTSITIPASVTSIGSDAFSGCNNIISAQVSTDHLSAIPKTNLQTVVITGGTSIGNSAFRSATSLTSITIPSSAEIHNLHPTNYYGVL